jgi:hypothetical protein
MSDQEFETNRKVIVQFPDKMKVDSPQIDAIKIATEKISNWLHEDFKEIVRSIKKLEEIPEILTDFKIHLIEQFKYQFSGQVAIQMKNRESNIRVIDNKSKNLIDHIETKKNQFIEIKNKLFSRFKNWSERIIHEHELYLKELDGHVFDICEKIYPDEIQNKFSYESSPFWLYFSKHISATTAARSSCITEAYDKASTRINNLIKMRKTCFMKEEKHDSLQLQSGRYEIPFWYVKTIDQSTGKEEIEVFFSTDLFDKSVELSSETKRKITEEALNSINENSDSPFSKNTLDHLRNENQKLKQVPEPEMGRFIDDYIEINL